MNAPPVQQPQMPVRIYWTGRNYSSVVDQIEADAVNSNPAQLMNALIVNQHQRTIGKTDFITPTDLCKNTQFSTLFLVYLDKVMQIADFLHAMLPLNGRLQPANIPAKDSTVCAAISKMVELDIPWSYDAWFDEIIRVGLMSVRAHPEISKLARRLRDDRLDSTSSHLEQEFVIVTMAHGRIRKIQ